MKWRFMAAVMAVALLVILVQDIPLSAYLQQVEQDRIITALERDAFVLAGRSEDALSTPERDDDQEIIDAARLYREAGGARVVIVDAAGIAVATSDDDQSRVGASYASRPEIMAALAGDTVSGERYSTTLSQQLLYVTVPVISGTEIHGAVRLTYPAQVVADAVAEKVRVLWLVALTTVVLAGVVAWIFSSGVTRRLRLLREATERLADGRRDWHADEKSGAPELRSLSKSFNIMAARLHALIDQQRSFAADASHQLRTPLTALRLRLERARELLETDPPAAAERLAAAEAEVDRLGEIIEGLLMLSRTEASSAPVVPVDVAAVAIERTEHWQALAQESGVGIRFEGPETAIVSAVEGAAEQIIDNYVDNALLVSAPGDELIVRLTEEPGAVIVHVLDEGPGLGEEELTRAFDRFWQSGSKAGGSGLGLAIVAQLALASGATVALANRESGGLDASVRFAVPR